MSKNTTIDNFAKDLTDLLNEYGKEVFEVSKTAVREVGKEVESELHTAGDFKGTGKFKQGWKMQEEKTGSRLGYAVTVGNKTHGQLTHLLEFGHITQRGRRTKAFNFIAPINETTYDRMIKALERELK